MLKAGFYRKVIQWNEHYFHVAAAACVLPHSKKHSQTKWSSCKSRWQKSSLKHTHTHKEKSGTSSRFESLSSWQESATWTGHFFVSFTLVSKVGTKEAGRGTIPISQYIEYRPSFFSRLYLCLYESLKSTVMGYFAWHTTPCALVDGGWEVTEKQRLSGTRLFPNLSLIFSLKRLFVFLLVLVSFCPFNVFEKRRNNSVTLNQPSTVSERTSCGEDHTTRYRWFEILIHKTHQLKVYRCLLVGKRFVLSYLPNCFAFLFCLWCPVLSEISHFLKIMGVKRSESGKVVS